MKTCPLLLLFAAAALGSPAAGSDSESHLTGARTTSSSSLLSQISTMLSMSQVSMQVVDQSPVEDASDHRTISSFNVDGRALTDNSISEQIVQMIAKQMEDAGVTTDDLARYIDQQMKKKNKNPKNEQYPDAESDYTTEQPAGEAEDKEEQQEEGVEGKDGDGDKSDAVKEEGKDESDKVKKDGENKDLPMGSVRYPKQTRLRASKPSSSANHGNSSDPSRNFNPSSPFEPSDPSDSFGPSDPSGPSSPSGPSIPSSGGPDIFNNGTDFFKWLDDLIKRVKDRMEKDGSTMDDVAVSEHPGQMDGKPTRQEPTERHPIERQQRPAKTDDGDEKTDKGDRTSAVTGVEDWKSSENAHGGFDVIPKAVPMIVMSGNTYIKDIGNFRNSYQYGALPLNVRTIEPNGNDSGLDLDNEGGAEERQKKQRPLERGIRYGNTRRRDHLETGKRDGIARSRDHLLRSTARGNSVQGLDDGDTGNSRSQDEEGSSTYHSAVHGHDDGDSRGDDRRKQDEEDSSTYHSSVHGHDDGDSPGGYHSSVHGHDDGDSRGDSPRLLKASSGSVHGHDDGGTRSRGSGSVHGHDDGGSRSGGSGGNGMVHGHDDGGSRSGSSTSGDSSSVHGHDDGSLQRSAALLRTSQQSRTTVMSMSNVSLTVLGTALVVLAVASVVTARRLRVGVFRRTDYITV